MGFNVGLTLGPRPRKSGTGPGLSLAMGVGVRVGLSLGRLLSAPWRAPTTLSGPT